MRCPLRCEGRTLGEVRRRDEGCTVVFEAECECLTDGLYRAYLTGENGELPLGVLAPEDGRLRLRKRFPARETEKIGRITEARAEKSFSFTDESWKPLPPGPLLQNARLDRALAAIPEARMRRSGGGWELALPYAPERPFPLPELFCFARVDASGGRVLYRFDEKNHPIF